MKKKVFFFIENRMVDEQEKRIYRLMEVEMGTPTPAGQVREGVIDESENVTVIADSILKIHQITGDGVGINYNPPEGFDPKVFAPLMGPDLLVAREKLGLSPG